MTKEEAIAQLKPCPFCGESASINQMSSLGHYIAGCLNEKCEVHPSVVIAPPEFGVFLKGWNQRHESS